MKDSDYNQFIDTAAKNENLNESDLGFLSSYFNESIEVITQSIIDRRTMLLLVQYACEHLN
jgi:hypothetical protein